MRTIQRPLLVPLSIIAFALVFSSAGCSKEEPDTKKETMTVKNIQEARNFALNRVSWYSKFAQEADREKRAGTASLFRAVARSEEIHAKVHEQLLRSLNVEPTAMTADSVAIGTTLQTLKMAVSCEWSQVRSLYPNMIQLATMEGLPEVSEHFIRAQAVDLRHLELLKEAVDRGGKIPQRSYLLCSECGYLIPSTDVEECPGCKAKKDKFEKS